MPRRSRVYDLYSSPDDWRWLAIAREIARNNHQTKCINYSADVAFLLGVQCVEHWQKPDTLISSLKGATHALVYPGSSPLLSRKHDTRPYRRLTHRMRAIASHPFPLPKGTHRVLSPLQASSFSYNDFSYPYTCFVLQIDALTYRSKRTRSQYRCCLSSVPRRYVHPHAYSSNPHKARPGL